MGAPETVPFSSRERAEAFARTEGGRVLALTDITDDMVLVPVETGEDRETGDEDYRDRLHTLSHPAGG